LVELPGLKSELPALPRVYYEGLNEPKLYTALPKFQNLAILGYATSERLASVSEIASVPL
jgi:hypothetical protein